MTPLRWRQRAGQARDGIDADRRRRREAAVPVARGPPRPLGASYRDRNVFVIPRRGTRRGPWTSRARMTRARWSRSCGPGRRPTAPPGEGWQQWRRSRRCFTPAKRLSAAEYQALSAKGPGAARPAPHRHPRQPPAPGDADEQDGVGPDAGWRLQNNAVKFGPGTRDGLMISGGGFQGKTETACWAAAEFEDLWRGIQEQFLPGRTPGTGTCSCPWPTAAPGQGHPQGPLQDHPGRLRRPAPQHAGQPGPLGPGTVRDHCTNALRSTTSPG